MRRARPPDTNATCTRASISTSSPRMTRWSSVIEAPRRCCDHLEHIVHAHSFEKLDLHRAHHKGKARRFLLGLLEQRALIGTEKPQIVGAPALHETQVACVINHPAKHRLDARNIQSCSARPLARGGSLRTIREVVAKVVRAFGKLVAVVNIGLTE
jgi:hypothetical protein